MDYSVKKNGTPEIEKQNPKTIKLPLHLET